MTNDVVDFYEAIRKKWPNPTRPWNELHPQEQMMLVQAINMILQVLQ
jgi:hypothetical protein